MGHRELGHTARPKSSEAAIYTMSRFQPITRLAIDLLRRSLYYPAGVIAEKES